MPNVNILVKLSIATLGTTVIALGVAGTAQASGFSGAYDPSNWTLTNINSNGDVDTSAAPSLIITRGGDNGTFAFGQTSYTIAAAGNGLVSFDWIYETSDVDGPFYDNFGFVLNGVFTQLSNNQFSFQNGTFSTLVNLGDQFGFAVNTVDNRFGAASATIFNFSAPQAVPEPASLIGILGLGAFGATSVYKRKQKKLTVKA